ncbi:MAG: hypothetical protein WD271_07125 [Acidimicrobiia bacterium]
MGVTPGSDRGAAAARNDALAHHRFELAARIQVQLIDFQARQAKVAIEIRVLEQRCH